MLRRALIAVTLVGGSLAWVLVLYAWGYISLPGGWTINYPAFGAPAMNDPQLQARIAVPAGFSINRYAADLPTPRMLLFTAAGDLLVSAPRAGQVLLIERDRNGDGVADGQRTLLDHLYQPHGLALHDGWLYVAETTGVVRLRFDAMTGSVSGAPQRIIGDLPDGGNHWTRTVHVGPDGKLYVSVGSSCNVCIEDRRRAALLRYNLDGSGGDIYASGLRNAVDFAWQPGTGDLYATDNGRDLLGDDFPPDELNRIVQGGFYGWPFANGDRVPDPDYGTGHAEQIAASIPPAHKFGAHVAPLGIAFYEPPAAGAPATFPRAYHGAAFVAQHGSWNRSKKSGYQVVALHFGADGSITEEPFATGFMRDERVFGRPVDPAVGPDGALYVSDDFTGAIYRIAYGAQATAAPPRLAPTAALRDPLAGMPPADVQAAAQRGAALWNSQPCAACHVPGTAAPDMVRPLAGLRSKFTVDSLTAFLHAPRPPMPPVMVPEGDRRDLAVYLMVTYP